MGKVTKNEFENAVMKHTLWLTDADGGERANFTDRDLRNMYISGDFSDAIFVRANLSGVRISHSSQASFCGAIFTEAVCIESEFRGTNFSGAALTGANFMGAELREANFSETTLTESTFLGADLTDVNFQNADLRLSNFTRAALGGANFVGANLSGACIKGDEFWPRISCKHYKE